MVRAQVVLEVVSEGLGQDGWMHRHVLSHAPLDAQALLGAWAPDSVRQFARVRVWEDEARMHHVAARWPMRGMARWRVWGGGSLWERLVALWWIGEGGRISAAALEAAAAYQAATGDEGIMCWVRRLPRGLDEMEAVVTLPSGALMVVTAVRWVPRGFVIVTGKEAKWTRLGGVRTGTS